MNRKTYLKIGISLIVLALAFTLATGTARAQGNPIQQYCGNPSTAGSAAIVTVVSPWYCNNINQAAVQAWENWMPIAYAVTLLSFLIGTVLIMFGIALRSDRLRIFGTGEMYEAIATALIVILFSFVSAELFGIIPGFFVGSFSPYSIALHYISTTINTTGNRFVTLYQVATVDYFYATQTIVTCKGELPGSFVCLNKVEVINPVLKFAVLYSFFWPAWSLVDLITPGFMALHLEFYLIIFMMYAAIPVFLIPGVLFRAFIPTRHLGGMLMAVAIGFYFFMPILFAIAYYYTSTSATSQLQATTQALGEYGGCEAGAATCPDAVQNSVSPSSPLVEAISNAQNALAPFWLSTLFYPALISAMTYALIVQVAEILGGMAKTSSKLKGL